MIILVRVLSNLVEMWNIKYTWKVATRADFSDKKELDNEPKDARRLVLFIQNGTVLTLN
jgi:hypothetical protein